MDNFHTSALADVGAIHRNFFALSVMLGDAPSLECVSEFWCSAWPPLWEAKAAYVRGRDGVVSTEA